METTIAEFDNMIRKKKRKYSGESKTTQKNAYEPKSSASTFVELLKDTLTHDSTYFPEHRATDFDVTVGNNATLDLNTNNTDESADDILLSGNKRRQSNKCACFIKGELSRLYTPVELANSRLSGGKRRYKENTQDTSALSPGRLNTILTHAKRKFRDEYEHIENMNEVINSKCRQVKSKLKKTLEL